MTTYITFGFGHAHSVCGSTFDKDCVAVIEAETEWKGRIKAFEAFGDKWCMSSTTEPDMSFFPRGLINL